MPDSLVQHRSSRDAARCEQLPSPRPWPPEAAVYRDCDVDVEVRLRSEGPFVPVPEGLQCAAARFGLVIDTTGHVVMSQSQLLRSTSDSLAVAAARAIVTEQFWPARLAGRPVAQYAEITLVGQTGSGAQIPDNSMCGLSRRGVRP